MSKPTKTTKTINFRLEHILDPMRDDYKVINPNYKNLVLFTTKREIGKIYSFNFLTLLYSEMIKYELTDLDCFDKVLRVNTCYRVKKTVGHQIPEMFVAYHYRTDYTHKPKPKVIETNRFYDFRPKF